MSWVPAWTLMLFLVTGLAGCAGDAPPDGAGEDAALVATAETGVLRAVVVDEAIQPLVDVSVSVSRNGETVEEGRTDADGFFGVGGLEPGLYVVTVAPDGFFARQSSTTVEAGVDEPEVLKLVLQRDLAASSFHVQHVWDGHIVCAATGGNYCALPRLYTGIDPFDDNSVRLFYDEFVDVGRQPDFVQGEVVWDSTQGATPGLQNRWTATNPDLAALGSWNYTYGWGAGESPIVFPIDRDMITESRLGMDMGLNIEMFADTPGAVVDQPFQVFLTAFYGYAPPEGWRFVDDGTVPSP